LTCTYLSALVRDALKEVLWKYNDLCFLGDSILDRLDGIGEIGVEGREGRARVGLFEGRGAKRSGQRGGLSECDAHGRRL
jgi:hypothetical protein